jgi:hypothetical protein
MAPISVRLTKFANWRTTVAQLAQQSALRSVVLRQCASCASYYTTGNWSGAEDPGRKALESRLQTKRNTTEKIGAKKSGAAIEPPAEPSRACRRSAANFFGARPTAATSG